MFAVPPPVYGPRVAATCSEDEGEAFGVGGGGSGDSGSGTDDTDELMERAMGERAPWGPPPPPPRSSARGCCNCAVLIGGGGSEGEGAAAGGSERNLCRGGPNSSEGSAAGEDDWLFSFSHPGGGIGSSAAARAQRTPAGADPMVPHAASSPLSALVHPLLLQGQRPAAVAPSALTAPAASADVVTNGGYGDSPPPSQTQLVPEHGVAADDGVANLGVDSPGWVSRCRGGAAIGDGSGDHVDGAALVVQRICHTGMEDSGRIRFTNALPHPQEEFELSYLPVGFDSSVVSGDGSYAEQQQRTVQRVVHTSSGAGGVRFANVLPPPQQDFELTFLPPRHAPGGNGIDTR
eukprot:75049-Chlamydomonas_euryale.AAC.5